MAGGFDMWRFHKCSRTFIPVLRQSSPWVVFWITAVIMLTANLGIYPSIRSEARWFEIVREMLLTGDWLHPCINGQPYFDKPLVSYWFIAVLAKLNGGVVTEFIARMPSVLFSLAGLFCIISLARQFFSERAAVFAAWLLLSTYSFLVWGRLAEADMEQTVFILMAAALYMKYRRKASFWAYFCFWALCSIGAQTKGLPALVIPPMLALLDCLVRMDWRTHLNWKFFLAAFCGLLVYFVPFVLEAVTAQNYSASGLVLVFRENLVRVFNPWDHNDDPFYIYFAYLPRLLIPWSAFFVFALIDTIVKFKQTRMRFASSRDTLWLVLAILFIFILFSASKSRRSYYILPIVPFCVLLTAAWFAETTENRTLLRKITDIAARIVDVLIPAAAVLLMLLPAAWFILLMRGEMLPSSLELIGASLSSFAFIFSLILLIVWFKSRRREKRGAKNGLFEPHGSMNRVIPFIVIVMFTVFSIVIPTLSSTPMFEPTAPFLRDMGARLRRIAETDPSILDRTAFFGSIGEAEISYYMNLPRPIKTFSLEKLDDTNRGFYDDTVEILGPDEFRTFLADLKSNGGMVITRGDWFARIQDPDLLALLRDDDILMVRSSLNVFQESELASLKDNPAKKARFDRVDGKRLLVFYHISDTLASPVKPADTEGISQP